MRTSKVDNQQAFGAVHLKVKHNGRTGLWTEYGKLQTKILSEKDKFVTAVRPSYHYENGKLVVGEQTLAIECRRKDGSINVKGEEDLVRRLQNWANKKGFDIEASRKSNPTKFDRERKYNFLTSLFERRLGS